MDVVINPSYCGLGNVTVSQWDELVYFLTMKSSIYGFCKFVQFMDFDNKLAHLWALVMNLSTCELNHKLVHLWTL